MTFLKRFESSDGQSGEASVEAVLRNLRYILNAKRGYGSILEDFGISDLSHCSSREALVEILSNEIRETIAKYEPRVSLFEMSSIPNTRASQVSMVLTCELKSEQASFDLIFDTARTNFSVERTQAQ